MSAVLIGFFIVFLVKNRHSGKNESADSVKRAIIGTFPCFHQSNKKTQKNPFASGLINAETGHDCGIQTIKTWRTIMKTINLLALLFLAWISASVSAADGEFNKECALGLAMNHHVPTDCSVKWTADDGKIYCFSSEGAKSEFLKDTDANRLKAEVFWSQDVSH